MTVIAPERSYRPLAVAAAAGLGWGVACMFLQGILPGSLNSIVANSGAGWGVLAFAAGAVWHRSRLPVVALAGALVELGLVVGYYASVIVRYDQDPPSFWAYMWAALALVTGPVFGVAGAWWRSGSGWRPVVAVGLLSGLFAGEGAVRLATLPDKVTGWILVLAAVAFPLVLGRTWRDRLLGLAAALPLTGLAVGSFWILGHLHA
ncbi:MAG: hypothetical protein QOD41_1851 [Cryptosporangiaceae bacterium]|jgi:hypothetical protein|nr:hypothetical protein [Cryptosporangiaceae bacterium]